ncbi:MAG: hypothetical protein SGBAC_012945, partial [Bacillariaceae sp.]
MCNSEASSVNIRMATGPLKVYPMEGEGERITRYSEDSKEELEAEKCPLSFDDKFDQSCEFDESIASPIAYAAQQSGCAPLAVDIVRTMFRQEAKIYHHSISYYVDQARRNRPLKQSRRRRVETMDSWRASLIRWMYQVVDFSHVKRETVGVAVYFLDAAISEIIIRAMNRNQQSNARANSFDDYKVSFQLAAATALQLAIKTHDCKIIKPKDLVTLGRNAFTERDIIAMEVQIIQACAWYLHPPSVDCYLHQYQDLLFRILQQDTNDEENFEDTKETMRKLINLITEIVAPQAQYKAYPPSIVAYAIMLVAMAFVSPTTGVASVSPSQQQTLSEQVSLALCLTQDGKSRHSYIQREQQQDLLLQVIQDVQASFLESAQLDCSGLLQDMMIVESSSNDGLSVL